MREYTAPIIHGRPNPKNTFMLLDPVMFPIAASAFVLCWAACLLAKVSGRDVPIATKIMAVAASLSPITHPNNLAISITTAVINPMKIKLNKKPAHPLSSLGGGTIAKSTFHPIVQKCKNASTPDT